MLTSKHAILLKSIDFFFVVVVKCIFNHVRLQFLRPQYEPGMIWRVRQIKQRPEDCKQQVCPFRWASSDRINSIKTTIQRATPHRTISSIINWTAETETDRRFLTLGLGHVAQNKQHESVTSGRGHIIALPLVYLSNCELVLSRRSCQCWGEPMREGGRGVRVGWRWLLATWRVYIIISWFKCHIFITFGRDAAMYRKHRAPPTKRSHRH